MFSLSVYNTSHINSLFVVDLFPRQKNQNVLIYCEAVATEKGDNQVKAKKESKNEGDDNTEPGPKPTEDQKKEQERIAARVRAAFKELQLWNISKVTFSLCN